MWIRLHKNDLMNRIKRTTRREVYNSIHNCVLLRVFESDTLLFELHARRKFIDEVLSLAKR